MSCLVATVGTGTLIRGVSQRNQSSTVTIHLSSKHETIFSLSRKYLSGGNNTRPSNPDVAVYFDFPLNCRHCINKTLSREQHWNKNVPSSHVHPNDMSGGCNLRVYSTLNQAHIEHSSIVKQPEDAGGARRTSTMTIETLHVGRDDESATQIPRDDELYYPPSIRAR